MRLAPFVGVGFEDGATAVTSTVSKLRRDASSNANYHRHWESQEAGIMVSPQLGLKSGLVMRQVICVRWLCEAWMAVFSRRGLWGRSCPWAIIEHRSLCRSGGHLVNHLDGFSRGPGAGVYRFRPISLRETREVGFVHSDWLAEARHRSELMRFCSLPFLSFGVIRRKVERNGKKINQDSNGKLRFFMAFSAVL